MPLIAPYVPALFGGGVGATATKPTAALSGAQLGAATMLNTLTRVTATLSGTQKQSGTIGATLAKPVLAFSDTRPPIILSPTAALSGTQQQSGVMGATAAKATTALTGAQFPKGAINATASKLTISTTGISGSFITRDTTTGALMLNGQRIRLSGANAMQDIGLADINNNNFYGGTVNSGFYLTPHSQIDAVLDTVDLMNAKLIRSGAVSTTNHPLAIQPTLGVFNSTAIEVADYALQQCALRGIKVFFNLCNEYSDKPWYVAQTGGGADSNFHTRTATIDAFKAHISYVLNHVNQYTGIAYKNDPTIFAWETGNELTSSGLTNAQMAVWTGQISTHIKVTEGAQQLVMDGKYGLTGDWTNFDLDTVVLPYVDIYSTHAYDNGHSPTNMQTEAQVCHTFHKAFILGEWTWTDRSVPGATLAWVLNDMATKIDASAFIDADTIWDLLAPGSGWYDGFSLHRPANGDCRIPNPNFPFTPYFMPIAEEDSRGTRLVSHNTTMQGAVPALPAKASTLIDNFTTFDTAKWDARSGATVSAGRASLPSAASGGSAFSSDAKYDLTASSIIVELVTKNPGTGNSGCGMYVQPTQAPYTGPLFGFIIDGNTVNYRIQISSADNTTEAYSATNHRWLRLRADDASGAGAGTIYWDTSANGITWTTKRTVSAPGMLLNSLNLILYNENWGGDAGSGTALFDNFNISPLTLTATLPKTTASLTGAMQPSGTVGATLQKTTANFTGPTADIYDGGTPSSTGTDIYDGGTPSSTGTDIYDGGSP